MKKIAILVSNIGTGTNLEAIIKGVKSGKIRAEISAVVSDIGNTLALKRAKKYQLPIIISLKKEDLLGHLNKLNPDFICLAGWKQIIADEVIDAYPDRILNTHPGLIPDTLDGVVKNPDGSLALWNRGKMTNAAIQNFFMSKATYAGCTNHFLSHEFDFGKVLGRCFEKIRVGDTVESLYKRLKKKENKLYVDVLEKLCKTLTVLITDGGGRGSVLVDKYGQSKKVAKILVVPGNDLMKMNTEKPVLTYPDLKTTSISEILEICKKERVDLIDVAQDNAVEVGLVDKLLQNGFSVNGPTKKAGQIEWDKAWAREFMKKYDIPSPRYHIFTSQKEALKLVKDPAKKWFVKASGLAEGKGVLPAATMDQLTSAIKEMGKFGKAGDKFLIEEWKMGEEFSAFALSDGENFKIVGYAQDHKRVNDGDKGLNTGGMGCVSNPLVVDAKIKKQTEEIFEKVIKGLRKEGRLYKGVLYLGGMVVDEEVFIIEFNARWGDPEAEVIVPSIKNDFFDLADAIIMGKLNNTKIELDKKVRVVVAAVAKGYPLDYSSVKGKKVYGISEAKERGVKVYGAGIKEVNGDYIVNGGRVFYVVGEGKDIIEARERAYSAMKLISIEGDNLHFRTDIGWRDVSRIERLKDDN